MPRFAAVLFPVSWGWALAAARRRPPETAILVAFTGGFALLAYLFINWQPCSEPGSTPRARETV